MLKDQPGVSSFVLVGAIGVGLIAASCSSSEPSTADGALDPASESSGESESLDSARQGGSSQQETSSSGDDAAAEDMGSPPSESNEEGPGDVELMSPMQEGEGAASAADESSAEEADAVSDAVPSVGCGASEPPESGRFEIEVGGQSREYILRVPDDYDPNRAYPLVFALHWLGGSAQAAANASGGFYGLADVAGDQAVMVSPEGLLSNVGGGNSLGWDNPNGRDTAFMRAIVARFNEQLCIDQSRVFSTGFSYGGMMSFALACGAADMVRAIAPMAGTFASGCEPGDSPVAMFGFIGLQDSLLPASQNARNEIVSRNGCSQEATVLETSWCDSAGGGAQPCTCVSYQGCDEGFPSTWCEFTGGHQIAPNPGETLWNFFSQF